MIRDDGSPPKDNAKKQRRDNDDENGERYGNEDEEYPDDEQEHDNYQTARNLVQQVMCRTISDKIMLLCRLSAGMGTSHTSRCHSLTFRQPRARVRSSSSLSDALCVGSH